MIAPSRFLAWLVLPLLALCSSNLLADTVEGAPKALHLLDYIGADAERASRLIVAAIAGLQGERLGTSSVAATTKHFPGGGPQHDGPHRLLLFVPGRQTDLGRSRPPGKQQHGRHAR